MKLKFFFLLASVCFVVTAFGQSPVESPFNASSWGVVVDHPDMKLVEVRKGISYFKDDKVDLQIDVYLPPRRKLGQKLPVVVFMNGFGDQALKSSGVYRSWPKLVAAHGFVGVSMDSDATRLHESFGMLFKFLSSLDYVDGNRIGIYAASANIRESAKYLLSNKAHPGIKAAALYYGEVPALPYRKDLPVLFIVTELDARHMNYSTLWSNVLESKAPWTITMAPGMPHAFDVFSETSTAKRLVMETINFWNTHLRPAAVSTSKPSLAREIIATEYAGDYQKIVRLMRDWFRENPDSKDAAAYRLLGNSLMRIREYAEAEQVYKKSLELADDRGTKLNMVIISHALEKQDEAARYLREYEEGKTPEGFTYGYIARQLMPFKKYDILIPYFQRAIELGPHPSDYYNLAICYAQKGEADKAFQNLSNAVEKGFNYKNQYENDENLNVLKSDDRWAELQSKLH